MRLVGARCAAARAAMRVRFERARNGAGWRRDGAFGRLEIDLRRAVIKIS